jgi:hypothetical protein
MFCAAKRQRTPIIYASPERDRCADTSASGAYSKEFAVTKHRFTRLSFIRQ